MNLHVCQPPTPARLRTRYYQWLVYAARKCHGVIPTLASIEVAHLEADLLTPSQPTPCIEHHFREAVGVDQRVLCIHPPLNSKGRRHKRRPERAKCEMPANLSPRHRT